MLFMGIRGKEERILFDDDFSLLLDQVLGTVPAPILTYKDYREVILISAAFLIQIRDQSASCRK